MRARYRPDLSASYVRCNFALVSRNKRATFGRDCRARDASSAKQKYGWKDKVPPNVGENNVELLEIGLIKRPLQGTRSNDGEKVQALMESIGEVGLQEPIDVLMVDGKYYGFSGCHRFEACQRLGHEKILAKVRKGNQSTLRMHFM